MLTRLRSTTISLALMIWLGSRAYLQDYVSFGSLVAFPLFLNLLFRPVRMLADKFNTLQMGMVAANRVFAILETESQIEDKGTFMTQTMAGKIDLEQLHFSYIKGEEVLKGIDLQIPQ